MGALGCAWVDGFAWEVGWVCGSHCEVVVMLRGKLEGTLLGFGDVSEVSGRRLMVVLKARDCLSVPHD